MDLLFLFIILIFIYFFYNIETFENNDVNTKKIINNNIIPIENNIIEKQNPSNYNQDKIDFKNIKFKEEQSIQDIYNFLVDDSRSEIMKYDYLDSYETNEYYNLGDNNYGYTEFTNYNKIKKFEKKFPLNKEC